MKSSRVREVAERISPPNKGRGKWDTTKNQNKTLEEASDYLKEYADTIDKAAEPVEYGKGFQLTPGWVTLPADRRTKKFRWVRYVPGPDVWQAGDWFTPLGKNKD